MAAENTLRSYLVKLGFKVDQEQYRNFQENLRKTTLGAIELTKSFVAAGAATIAAGTAIAASLNAAAKPLESLYFAAKRTGSSARELEVLSLAAQQVGVSAEQARGAVESIASARYLNPGLNGYLANLGIDPRQTDNAKVLLELLARLHGMPGYQGARIAQMFGIDPQTFRQIETNGGDFAKALKEAQKATANVDYQKMAAAAHDFEMRMRELQMRLEQVGDQIATQMFPIAEKWIDRISHWITDYQKLDKATGGIPSKILGIAGALLTFSTVLNLFLKATGVSGLLKVGAKAVAGRTAAAAGEAVGGEAAGGAAVAEGGGLLALIGPLLPAIALLAAGAAIVWMTTHPEAVRKAAAKIWGSTKSGATAVVHAVARETHALPGQLSRAAHWARNQASSLDHQAAGAGGWLNALSLMPGSLGSLASLLQRFEGFSRKAYRDIAGNLTIGIGHLIKPGESFSGGLDSAGVANLFSKDLQGSIAAISRLVKVHLSRNQAAALESLEFNIGEKAFAGSTLLKDLNAGNYQAAAEQFAHWNKVLVNGHYEVSRGLANRRAAEAALFLKPDSKTVTLHQETNIHVDGSKDPAATGREVARLQSRTNGDMVRNLAGATR